MNFDPRTWQLTTERLTLRGADVDDTPLLNAAVCESLSELQLWVPWARSAPTLEESAQYAHSAAEKFQSATSLEARMWTHEGTFIGCIGLMTSDKHVPSFEMGYWCRTSQSGCGYTSEAVRALTTFAIDQLGAQRLRIRCDTRNGASRRVAEKCGYQWEATLHHDARDALGHLRDTDVLTRFPDITK